MKRVVITGGAGFIGSNLTRHLAASGLYEVVVIDNESTGSLKGISNEGVNFIKGDILDTGLLTRVLKGSDTVVHFAADTRVIDSILNPDINFETNVFGSYGLLREAHRAGVRRFVNASTGGAILGDVAPPVDESMAAKPISPYGASKLAVEGYCDAFYGAYGINTISLRFSNVFGPGSYHKSSVVAHVFKCIIDSKEFVIYGDGSQVRDFLFVGDLVDVLLDIIESNETGVFQLGSGVPVNINELIEVISEVVGDCHKLNIRYEDFRRGEIRETWANIDKSRRTFDFDPKTSLYDGLDLTWRSFLDER